MLAGLADPYNPERTKQAIERNQRLLNDSPVGQVVGVTKLVLSNIPAIGQIFGLLSTLGDLVGNAVQSMSHGGFDNLPVLSKQRIAIYFWGTTGSQYKIKPPSGFMQNRPARPLYGKIDDEYRKQYTEWLRNSLIQGARDQQYKRIAMTPDEPMLPAEKINALFAAGLWPPPLEPFPLTFGEWKIRYPLFLQNSWYVWVPPAIDGDLAELSKQVYDNLIADYRADAEKFVLATNDVTLSTELIALARSTDMVPPLGSPANPLRATRSAAP